MVSLHVNNTETKTTPYIFFSSNFRVLGLILRFVIYGSLFLSSVRDEDMVFFVLHAEIHCLALFSSRLISEFLLQIRQLQLSGLI